MRRFWLKKGEVIWDLSSDVIAENQCFMAEPQGLGMKMKIESFEVERATFIENTKIEGAEISGKLYFKDYVQFIDFASFIDDISAEHILRLYYSTSEKIPDFCSINEWYKLVLIKELKKGEIDKKTGLLICDIKFATLSPWKKDQIFKFELDTDRYSNPDSGRPNVALNIDNFGNLPTPCTIKVEGDTDTPEFYIIKNGKYIERARYNIHIKQGSYMLINSDPAAQEASLYTGTERKDIYSLGERDYAFSNFLTIPTGKCMFMLVAQNKKFGKVTLSYSLQRELI